ncbi:hypothetical protein MYA_3919 [Burkholderia sp. KJ006]|nr:hypothetical protein MYA_3919 [Burkholderia sp. KJ006]
MSKTAIVGEPAARHRTRRAHGRAGAARPARPLTSARAKPEWNARLNSAAIRSIALHRAVAARV